MIKDSWTGPATASDWVQGACSLRFPREGTEGGLAFLGIKTTWLSMINEVALTSNSMALWHRYIHFQSALAPSRLPPWIRLV